MATPSLIPCLCVLKRRLMALATWALFTAALRSCSGVMFVSSAPLRNRPTERDSRATPPPSTTPRPNCTLLCFLGGRRIDQHRPLGNAADLAVQQFAVDHGHVRQAGFQQVTAAEARGLAAIFDPQFHVEMVALLDARPQEAADDHQRIIARGQQLIGVFHAPPLHFGHEHRPLRRGLGVAARAVQAGDQADGLDLHGKHAEGHGQVADRMGLVFRQFRRALSSLLGEKRLHEEQPASNEVAHSRRKGRRFMLPCTVN